MLNWSDIASSVKHFTKDGDHLSSFLSDVVELWELEMGASQNISVVSYYVHSWVSILFAMYFAFHQKSLKIGLYGNFFKITCFATEQQMCATHMRTSCCAKTWPLKVTAPPLEKGILVRKDLGEEVQGCVCSSCLVEEEILILLCQQKTVNDFFWSFRHAHLWLAELISAVLSTELCLHVTAVHQVPHEVI